MTLSVIRLLSNTSVADANGNVELQFPTISVISVYSGSVSVPASDSTNVWIISVQGLPLGTSAGSTQYGPFVGLPGEIITMSGSGCVPGKAYQATFTGSEGDLTDYPSPTATSPGSVVVSGPVEVSGSVSVTGDVGISGPVTVAGNVGVTGPVDVNGSTINVANATVSPLINAGSFVVRDVSSYSMGYQLIPVGGSGFINLIGAASAPFTATELHKVYASYLGTGSAIVDVRSSGAAIPPWYVLLDTANRYASWDFDGLNIGSEGVVVRATDTVSVGCTYTWL